MQYSRLAFVGAASAVFLTAAGMPVQASATEQRQGVAAAEKWPRNFRPNLALTLNCNKSRGTFTLKAFDISLTIPLKLVQVPAQFKKITYKEMCYEYFMVSDIVPRSKASYAAVVANNKSKLVQWAGGPAHSQDGTHWLFMTNHYTALVQTSERSNARVVKPGKNGKVNLPHLPSS